MIATTPHGVRSGWIDLSNTDGQRSTATLCEYNFSNSDEWPKWRKCFEQFCIASGMAGESEERPISTLLYCFGEEAEDILTEADRGRYAQVLGKMNKFFKIQKNAIFE